MASTKIRGITIEIGADATGVGKALKQVDSDIKSTSAQLRDVNKLLKLDPKNTELMAQKQKLLKDAISQTKDKLQTLTKAEEDLKKQMVNGGTEEQKKQLMALQREIASTQIEEKKLNKESEECNSKFGKLKETAKKLASGMAAAAKEIAVCAAKVTAATMAAAGTAVVALTKQAVESYAEMEQLIGGVDKLFGNASDSVVQNAREAFKTAGMSANEYMETVTSFSASLISSLGGDTEKAASYADQAIRDMSDNANTFGTDMESVQKAYEGFAKGNYGMLDNLKLGFGGSKEGMQALIDKANELRKANGQMANLTIDSYADIVDAIHEVQVSMNIAGTTEREAATTIEGSLNMVKGAWTNMVAGLADSNADLSALIGNLVDSGKALLNNLKPVIIQALKGIAEAIKEIAPVIIRELPLLVSELLPAILESVSAIVTALADVLPELINTLVTVLVDNIPLIVSTGMLLFTSLIGALPEIINGICEHLPELITGVVNGLMDHLPELIVAGVQLFVALISNLPAIIAGIIQAIPQIILGICNSFKEAWPQIKEAGKNLLLKLKEGLGSLFEIGKNWVKGLWNGIQNVTNWIVEKIKGFGQTVTNTIKKIFGIASPSKKMAWVGEMLGQGLANGIHDSAHLAVDQAKTMTKGINNAMNGLASGSVNADVNAALVGQNATAMNSTTNNSIAINVYGSQSQNVNDLANVVMEKIQMSINRKGAVYA